MKLERLKELHGTDGNEACHEFWDRCGTELIAMWEAGNTTGKAFNAMCKATEDEDAGVFVPNMPELEDHLHESWKAFAAATNSLNQKLAAFE